VYFSAWCAVGNNWQPPSIQQRTLEDCTADVNGWSVWTLQFCTLSISNSVSVAEV
jgi:hypothetical protein